MTFFKKQNLKNFTKAHKSWNLAKMPLLGKLRSLSRIIIIIIALVVSLFFNFHTFVFAQSVNSVVTATNNPTNASSPLSTAASNFGATKVFCSTDFTNFLSTTTDFDIDSFLDYWSDILDVPWIGWSRYSSNICHFTDVDSLLRRLDGVRKQLREAFYVCDKATSQKLTRTYYDLSAELYYLRHFISTKPGNIVELKPDEVLKNTFLKKFGPTGKQYFPTTQETLDAYQKLKNKYAAKLATYQNCSDSNILALKQKLQELVGILDTLNNLTKRFQKRVEQKNSLVNQRIKQNSYFSATNGTDFLNRLIDFRVNGDDITEPTYWEKLTGGSAASSSATAPQDSVKYSFFDAERDISSVKTRDTNQALDAFYSSEYDLLYRQTGDQISSEAVQNLETLKSIIHNTFAPLKKLGSCTSTIVSKQCPQ